MRIDLLKTAPDRAGRYYVKFSDETSMKLYRQTVEDFGLYTGKELSEEEMDALRKSAGQMSAKMRAVRIVSASSVSKRDLQQRLVQKGEDPEQAKEAVAWMSDLNLLDDARVADSVSRQVANLNYHTAGGRLRFRTDSPVIEMRYTVTALPLHGHSAGIIGRLCVIGADLDRAALSDLFGAELK